MDGIRRRYRPPANKDEFLFFSVRLLRRKWDRPQLRPYGHDGEGQFGVDIFDPSGITPILAAQCKCHDPLKTIPPKEITDEVEKAKSFEPKLDHYTILTTAKRSKQAQNAVLRLNQRHRESGLFEVEVLDWNDLEEWFDEHPGVYEEIVGELKQTTDTSVESKHSAVQVTVESGTVDSTGDTFHSEIDEAKALLEKHQFEAARAFLERLRSRHWDKLSPRHKYRLLGNIGSSYLEEGNLAEAARFFLEAKSHQPNDEQARTNEAIAYELLDNPAKASELADAIRKDFPTYPRPLAVWLRNAPPTLGIAELEKHVPDHLKDQAEVLVSLVVRALKEHSLAHAERFARKATAVSQEWPPAWTFLGQAILADEWEKERDYVVAPKIFRDTPRVREANDCLTKAVELAKSQRANRVLVAALLSRSISRSLLDDQAADDDIREAYRLKPDSPEVLMRLAAIEHNKDQAIEFLRQAVKHDGGDQAEFLLAIALIGRDQAADRTEATALFERVARQADSTYRTEALGLAIENLSKLGRWKEADELLDTVTIAPPITEAFVAALRGQLFFEQGNVAAASEQADLAVAKLTSESSRKERGDTAALLSELGRHEEALPLWQQLATLSRLTSETRCFIACARQLERDDLVLEACRTLRLAGVETRWVLDLELDLLQEYDIEEAIRVLKEHLAKHPGDRLARLRISVLGVLMNQQELVSANLDEIPAASEVTPAAGGVAVRMLLATGRTKEAVEYAYQLLRRHFDQAEVHIAYFEVIMFGDREEGLLSHSGLAGPGAAVCYAEDDKSPERWVVIEDSDTCYPSLNEISPTHHLAQRLLGKRAGEEVVLAQASTQHRTAIIKTVVNKYLYRLCDCREQYQLRFPDKPWLEQIDIGKTSAAGESQTVDFGLILKAVDQRHQFIEEAEGWYQSHLLPIQAFGKLVGEGTAFRSIYHLATRSRVRVKCCLGTHEERNEALAFLGKNCQIIVDLTAIGTLALLEQLEVLRRWSVKPVVSQATLVALRELALHARVYERPGGHMAKAGDGYTKTEVTEENVERWRDHIESVVERVTSTCEIVGGQALASVDPKARSELIELFAHHGAESIILARQPGCVLWSDDLVLAKYANEKFGTRRVWTQAALLSASQSGKLLENEFSEASAKLFGFNYYFTFLNASILNAAAKLGEWNPDRWPLKQTLDSLNNDNVTAADQLRIAAEFIASVFADSFVDLDRKNVVMRLLDRLGKRKRGFLVIQALAKQLPKHFTVNPIRAREARDFIDTWLATSQSIVLA